MVRRLFAASLLALTVGPLLPVLTALCQPHAIDAFAEWDRLASLLLNTALIAVLAVAVAVPLGSLLAAVIARGPAFPARVFRAAVLVGLAVPLPVLAVAWQVVLGGWLPGMALDPGAVAWRAWNTGLLPAGWVHGMAGVPWVAWVVGGVLARTDQTLEDDATLSRGWTAVLWRVVVPRAALASLVGGGWVAVQTATEIPVTDAMMVRTFAEEVYTQLVIDHSRVGAAVAVSLPVWAAGAAAGVLAVRRVRVSADVHPARPLLGTRWAFAGGAVTAVFAGVPLAALVVRASAGGLAANLSSAALANGQVLLPSLLWAAVAGVVTAWLARRACWHAARSRWFAGGLVSVCVLLFLAPGPVVGFGLKEAIGGLVDAERWAIGAWGMTFPPVRSALYDQPSPLPVLWAAVVRLFPVACAVLWPAVRAIPLELYEAAAIDGGDEWRWVVAPLTRRAFAAAVVGVTALSLGEVSAAKVAAPPGYRSFILELFQLMHYGAEPHVAALALVQVAATAVVMLVGVWRSGNENRRGP
jgi:iron(III) transport system permease protein